MLDRGRAMRTVGSRPAMARRGARAGGSGPWHRAATLWAALRLTAELRLSALVWPMARRQPAPVILRNNYMAWE